ncbi:hypothetical protein [Mycolicibacterium madagascariense]|uniref:hypothetical protein n=1 Tax=Mycolicibacterium madagascariense TaxID=212765 RepID=UPI0035579ECD
MKIALRSGMSASLALSGVLHAYLYIDSYHAIPTIGPAFLLQASLSCAVATLTLLGGPWWMAAAAAALSAGSLCAFALSRTIGLFGFTEIGWEPTPYAALTVITETLTIALCVAMLVGARRRTTHPSMI